MNDIEPKTNQAEAAARKEEPAKKKKASKAKKGERKAKKGERKAKKGERKAKKDDEREAKKEEARRAKQEARKAKKAAAALRPRKLTLEYQEPTTREDAVARLEILLGAVRSGSVRIERDGEALTLEVPTELSVGVKASRSRKTERLTLSVRWPREGEAPAAVEQG
jgi:amphi-Trp domain-containing protein